jgi:hypothetical protein
METRKAPLHPLLAPLHGYRRAAKKCPLHSPFLKFQSSFNHETRKAHTHLQRHEHRQAADELGDQAVADQVGVLRLRG